MIEPAQSRVHELFDKAVRLADEDRDRFLEEHCGSDQALRLHVEALLEWDAAAGTDFLQSGFAGLCNEMPASRMGAGTQIGPYTLLSPIGEGGMAIVWLAHQNEPVHREVALKILRAGMDSGEVLARFEAERQALALMDHPHVARIFDGGLTETGRPYFIMEHVHGVPITEYCDGERLSIRQRLELFVLICQAVQHAHQKGLIHRDLKPSNILVSRTNGEPIPKVIDFGIAKAITTPLTQHTLHTEMGRLMGTPEYMSPEQAGTSGQDVDTRSDVYALGVILYQLLTGTLPFEPKMLRNAGYDGIVKIIRAMEPSRPSTRLATLGAQAVTEHKGLTPEEIAARRDTDFAILQRKLRGELDWIVMKCLEKDRTRRYETANALAMEIRRYLANEPVEASPPSRIYRLRKLVQRNRGSVVAAALVAAALVIGLGLAVWQAVRADRLRQLAEGRQQETEQVASFHESQLGGVDVAKMGQHLQSDILDRWRTALELDGRDEDEIQRALLDLQQSLHRVNFTDVARASMEENIFEPTLQAIQERFAEQPLVQAQLLQSIANVMRELQMFDRATTPQEQALQIRQRELGDTHLDTLRSITATAYLLEGQAKVYEAEPYLRQALEGARRELGDEHRFTLQMMNSMGVSLHSRGKYAESIEYYSEALEIARRKLGTEAADNGLVLTLESNIAYSLVDLGKPEEAEALFREILQRRRRVLGNDAPGTLSTARKLGEVLYLEGKLEEAEPLYREALESYRRIYGDEHNKTLNTMNALGNLLSRMGEFEEAERLLAEAVRRGRDMWLGERPSGAAYFLANHARTLTALARFEQAEAELLEAQELFENPDVPIRNADHYARFSKKLAEGFANLYDAWHIAEPDAGYDIQAAPWRAKLEQLQAADNAEADGENSTEGD